MRRGEAGLARVAAEIGQACRDIGFFYVRNTPVPPGLRAAVFEASRAFFASPPAAKAAVAIGLSLHSRGYVGLDVEALDPGRGVDSKEAFNIGLDLAADDPEVLAGKPFRGLNLWPALPGFRETLLAYYDALFAFGRDLHRAIAVDLGLPPHHFDEKLRRPLATLRLLHYPALPAEGLPEQLGAGEHTDYGNLTLLATDDVGGLEVRMRDGTWMRAPVIPGTFVCNIGDCLMRWTNDTYVSTPHRVVSPAMRDRYSVAFFLDANPDVEVACLPTCRSGERPPLYPPVTVGRLSEEPSRRHLCEPIRGITMTTPPGTRQEASAGLLPARNKKSTKAHDIQQALATDIVHGRLLPGAGLDESKVARDFGVSRTPVREAIRQLEIIGLVETRPHCGAVVASIADDRLDDMFAVMAELESLCARWSALAMSTAERRDLREIHARSAAFMQSADRERYVQANDRFHAAIYEGAHSPYLAEITRAARTRVSPFRRVQFEDSRRLSKSFHEHEGVVAAIERGDGEEAQALMRAHIGVVRNAVDLRSRDPTRRSSHRTPPQVRSGQGRALKSPPKPMLILRALEPYCMQCGSSAKHPASANGSWRSWPIAEGSARSLCRVALPPLHIAV